MVLPTTITSVLTADGEWIPMTTTGRFFNSDQADTQVIVTTPTTPQVSNRSFTENPPASPMDDEDTCNPSTGTPAPFSSTTTSTVAATPGDNPAPSRPNPSSINPAPSTSGPPGNSEMAPRPTVSFSVDPPGPPIPNSASDNNSPGPPNNSSSIFPGRGSGSARLPSVGHPPPTAPENPPIVLLPPRPHTVRYDLRINLPPSDSSTAQEVLSTTLREILSQLWSEDPNVVVYPWADDHVRANRALHNSSELPATNGALRRYFSRINPRPAGGPLYVMVRLGHSIPMSEIMESIGWWLREQNHGLWARALQAQETVVVGWLLNSTREMDLVRLQAAMLEIDPRLEVGLRWRLISLGQAGAIPVQQQVRAIHVEIDKLKVSEIKPILYRIYGHAAVGPFPNGVRMRLVPEITPLMGPNSRAKADRLRNRQANFVQYSIKIANWEIATLDYVDTELDASLRDLLLAIRARSRPQISLIHSVDAQWQGNGYIVTVIPEFQSEARTVLAGIIPFLTFHYSDHKERVEAMFTPAAVERAQSAVWDPVSYAVITAEDGILAQLEEVDADLDIAPSEVMVEGGPSNTVHNTPTRPAPGRLQGRTLYGGDTDSVSTINTRGTQHTNRPRGRPPVNSSQSHPPESTSRPRRSHSPSAATQQSSVSSMTMEDRVASVENNVHRVLTILENMSMTSRQHNSGLTTPTLASVTTGASSQDHSVGQPVVTPGIAGGSSQRAAGFSQ